MNIIELAKMRSYYWEEDGKIKVQNMVAGMRGQLHEHTKKDFLKWKKDAEQTGIEVIKTKDLNFKNK